MVELYVPLLQELHIPLVSVLPLAHALVVVAVGAEQMGLEVVCPERVPLEQDTHMASALSGVRPEEQVTVVGRPALVAVGMVQAGVVVPVKLVPVGQV